MSSLKNLTSLQVIVFLTNNSIIIRDEFNMDFLNMILSGHLPILIKIEFYNNKKWRKNITKNSRVSC